MTLSLVAYQEIAYNVATTTRTFASITWSAGDLVTIFGATEDSGSRTLGTPTVAGITFTALTGSPKNAASNCWVGAWQGTAAAGGSGTVSITAAGTASVTWGAGLWQWNGHNGVGTIASSQTSGAVASVSMAISANSAVCGLTADWSATAAGYTGTPTVNVEREDAVEGSNLYTVWSADWLNQAAGTRNYGKTTTSGTKDTLFFVEIKEAGATATSLGQGRSRTLVGLKIR